MLLRVDLPLICSALFLLWPAGRSDPVLTHVAGFSVGWGLLFLTLPGHQKTRLQTIGAIHGGIAWLCAAYLLLIDPPQQLSLAFDSHATESAWLFKLVTGFYFWLSGNSLTLRFRSRDHWLTTAHHIAVTYVYGFCLFPHGYLHFYGLLYLVQESSSFVMALRSFAARKGFEQAANGFERLAVVLFVGCRILLGVPVSMLWWYRCVAHELVGWDHPKLAVLMGYMLCNILLNSLNMVWLCNIINHNAHMVVRMSNSQCVVGCNQHNDDATCAVSCYSSSEQQQESSPEKVRRQYCEAFQKVLREPAVLAFTAPLCARAERCAHELVARYGKRALEEVAVDVVIGGGGWRGQYAGGALSILQALQKQQLPLAVRYGGASIGAITAAYFAACRDYSDYVASHTAWQELWRPSQCWQGKHVLRAMLDGALPADAHKRCDGKVYANISLLTFPPAAVRVNKFKDKEALVEALVASASLPGLTGSLPFDRFKGVAAIDGGLTDNVPLFTDGVRDQLVVNLGWLEHPIISTLTPLGVGHEHLVMAGQDDAMAVLHAYLGSGEESKRHGGVEIMRAGSVQRGYLKHRWATDVRPWMTSLTSHYTKRAFASPAYPFFAVLVALLCCATTTPVASLSSSWLSQTLSTLHNH